MGGSGYHVVVGLAGLVGGQSTAGQVPDVGRVIAVLSTRKAWRVIWVDDIHQANWTPETERTWEAAGRPAWETWPGRERRVAVEPPLHPNPDGKDRRGIRLSLWWRGQQWAYLEEPWPECVQCGLLWPCPCRDENQAAEAAMAEMDRLGQIMPGCCWACHEPVTGRHHSVVFDGENLLLPGAGPAVFHTSYSRKAARGTSGNQTCRGEAERYEERWVAAGEGRRVRLRCTGILWSHFGYRECTSGDLCTGPDATHRHGVHHCTVASYTWRADGTTSEERPVTNCGSLGCKGEAASPPGATATASNCGDDTG